MDNAKEERMHKQQSVSIKMLVLKSGNLLLIWSQVSIVTTLHSHKHYSLLIFIYWFLFMSVIL